MNITTQDIERFRKFMGSPNQAGCCLWEGYVQPSGYGRFMLNGKAVRSSRFAYAAFRGPIPAGMCVLHSCDTPACVNPKHLRVGSIAENNAEKEAKGRANHPRGLQHGRLKLTPGVMRTVRRMLASGATQARVASATGISRASVYNVANNSTSADAA